MRRTATIAQMLVRVTGLFQIVLGLLFWIGIARSLIQLHMVVGTLLVLGLWTLGFLAIQNRANVGLGAFALVWGLIVVGLGMAQAQLLAGPAHWVIEGVHLLVGLAAMGLAERLARSLLGRDTAVSRT